jgi:hypothetical protein
MSYAELKDEAEKLLKKLTDMISFVRSIRDEIPTTHGMSKLIASLDEAEERHNGRER